MTVSYKSDFTPRYNTLCLIINHLSNWYYTKYPENLWKIILPVKLGLNNPLPFFYLQHFSTMHTPYHAYSTPWRSFIHKSTIWWLILKLLRNHCLFWTIPLICSIAIIYRTWCKCIYDSSIGCLHCICLFAYLKFPTQINR